jgi:uncharacterized membrane protein YvlD (DUF360 family)
MAEIVADNGGRLTVDLVSADGSTLRLVDETVAPSIRLVSIPVTTLASGMYRLLVTLNGAVTSRPIAIIR